MRQSRAEILAKVKEWRKEKAAKDKKAELEKISEEKAELELMIRMMESLILGIGNPEREMREFLERDVTADFIKGHMKDLKTQLSDIEKEKRILVATDGEHADMWEQRIEADVRVKYQAALLVGAEGLKKLELESLTAASRTLQQP